MGFLGGLFTRESHAPLVSFRNRIDAVTVEDGFIWPPSLPDATLAEHLDTVRDNLAASRIHLRLSRIYRELDICFHLSHGRIAVQVIANGRPGALPVIGHAMLSGTPREQKYEAGIDPHYYQRAAQNFAMFLIRNGFEFENMFMAQKAVQQIFTLCAGAEPQRVRPPFPASRAPMFRDKMQRASPWQGDETAAPRFR